MSNRIKVLCLLFIMANTALSESNTVDMESLSKLVVSAAGLESEQAKEIAEKIAEDVIKELEAERRISGKKPSLDSVIDKWAYKMAANPDKFKKIINYECIYTMDKINNAVGEKVVDGNEFCSCASSNLDYDKYFSLSHKMAKAFIAGNTSESSKIEEEIEQLMEKATESCDI